MRLPLTALALSLVMGSCFGARSGSRAPGSDAGSDLATTALPERTAVLPRQRTEDPESPLEWERMQAPQFEHIDSLEVNGSGYRRGIGGVGSGHMMPPWVDPGVASVHGSLDKEIVRRIFRLHFNEVTYCYERELVARRTFSGRATFEFVISPLGQVLTARLRRSTLHNPRAEECLVAAVLRWQFPHPLAGDAVTVSYPFHFRHGGPGYVPTMPAEPVVAPAPPPIR
jgi:TonB family protein